MCEFSIVNAQDITLQQYKKTNYIEKGKEEIFFIMNDIIIKFLNKMSNFFFKENLYLSHLRSYFSAIMIK